MATVDLFLGSKGGISKSVCATILFQYLMLRDVPVVGVDTDPKNHSLLGYKDNKENLDRMDVVYLEFYDPKTKLLKEERIDVLLDKIQQVKDNSQHIIVDIGASIYVPVENYLVKYQTVQFLQDAGHVVNAHMPIVSKDVEDILEHISQISKEIPSLHFFFWLNPFLGDILEKVNSCRRSNMVDVEDYTAIEQITALAELAPKDGESRIDGFVRMPDYCLDPTFINILNIVFSQHYTFKTVLEHDPLMYGTMPNQRVRMFWRKMVEALDEVRPIIG